MTEHEEQARNYTDAYAAKYGIVEKDLLEAIYLGHLAYLDSRSPMDEVKAEYVARTGVEVEVDDADVRLQAVRGAWGGELATWHDFILDQIECVTEHGLPAVYTGDIGDFLFDLLAGDMPWRSDLVEVVDTNIRRSPRLESLRAAFKERFGVDPYSEDYNPQADEFWHEDYNPQAEEETSIADSPYFGSRGGEAAGTSRW